MFQEPWVLFFNGVRHLKTLCEKEYAMGNMWAKCVGCLACTTCYTCGDPELNVAMQTADFSLEGQRFRAKVVSVYDGDTIRVKFRLGGKLYQMRARMAGYDSPEMKPLKTAPYRDEEKKAAVAARDALIDRIGGQMVHIHCGGFDKYGRLLITVYKPCGFLGLKDGFNINEWMIVEKYGVPYDGGTKKQFAPEEHEEHAGPQQYEPSAGEMRDSGHAIVNPKAHAVRTGGSGHSSAAIVKRITADKPAATATATDAHEPAVGGTQPVQSTLMAAPVSPSKLQLATDGSEDTPRSTAQSPAARPAKPTKKMRKTPDMECVHVDQPCNPGQEPPSPDSL
jgi:endonuclease YncB( thermonuclease family)